MPGGHLGHSRGSLASGMWVRALLWTCAEFQLQFGCRDWAPGCRGWTQQWSCVGPGMSPPGAQLATETCHRCRPPSPQQPPPQHTYSGISCSMGPRLDRALLSEGLSWACRSCSLARASDIMYRCPGSKVRLEGTFICRAETTCSKSLPMQPKPLTALA